MTRWRDGHALLAARLRDVPAALRRTAARTQPPLGVGPTPIRRVVATGVGSSAAHAALLVHVLRWHGIDAHTEPLSSFLRTRPRTTDDVLVVFSQGLSPNAELALTTAERWRRVVLVTAVTDTARLAPLSARGVVVQTIDGEDEYGTLVRVVGPMTGYLGALRVAQALGGPAVPDVERIVGAIEAARAPALDPEAIEGGLAFVTTGTYGELVTNLQYKVMEGALRPMPAVWDCLQVAHGPLQERFRHRTTFVALARADAVDEPALLDRLERMLAPDHHRIVRLHATLPAPLAVFEHEALLDQLVLRYIEARHVDQVEWPGRGHDAPLYGLTATPSEQRLAALVWPEVAARLAHEATTVILPLGSTEQHGPHLPFATDTLIADALAERLAGAIGAAIALPALPLGCASEHMSFPGTLDVSPATLVAVLRDVLRALASHGVRDVFVFSAHGGNVAALRDALPELRAARAEVGLAAHTDLSGLTAHLHAESARCGLAPEAAGRHAGEVETSIMLALHPALVRTDALAAGHVEPSADPQALFYPDLRRSAASGVIGDPRAADATRGRRYLDVWVDVLAAAYREAKKRA